MQTSIRRNRPLGNDPKINRTVKQLGLQHTIGPEGQPEMLTDKDRPEKN